ETCGGGRRQEAYDRPPWGRPRPARPHDDVLPVPLPAGVVSVAGGPGDARGGEGVALHVRQGPAVELVDRRAGAGVREDHELARAGFRGELQVAEVESPLLHFRRTAELPPGVVAAGTWIDQVEGESLCRAFCGSLVVRRGRADSTEFGTGARVNGVSSSAAPGLVSPLHPSTSVASKAKKALSVDRVGSDVTGALVTGALVAGASVSTLAAVGDTVGRGVTALVQGVHDLDRRSSVPLSYLHDYMGNGHFRANHGNDGDEAPSSADRDRREGRGRAGHALELLWPLSRASGVPDEAKKAMNDTSEVSRRR
ncbi:hypothetical protein THAOC_15506, partial [Thalassiosira oceanica]